ncbi:MAG: hypothetical protein J6F30_12685 [Cellulosilyticum sp.]|nr:hypothetical protein [Cellulosilyticum sp.]
MTNKEAIEIIRNEIKCVNNDSCKRKECAECNLVMESKEPIIEAFNKAIEALEKTEKTKQGVVIIDKYIDVVGMSKLDELVEQKAYELECLRAYKNIVKSGDCNNCALKGVCSVAPKLGQPVRYNCYAYVPKDYDKIKD